MLLNNHILSKEYDYTIFLGKCLNIYILLYLYNNELIYINNLQKKFFDIVDTGQ